jgi:hypothetical protein
MKNIMLVFAIMLLSFSVGALASPVLYDSTYWPAANVQKTVAPFTDNATLEVTPSVTPGDNYVDLKFTGAGLYSGADIWTTASQFTTDLPGGGPDLNIKFTLQNMTMAPNTDYGSLAVYFQYGALVTQRWYFDLTPPTGLLAQTYTVNIGRQAGWYGGEGDYLTTLGTVTQLGFELIAANDVGEQIYRFSDVQFTVPEPETVWMILMVLASLGITFRSRLMELAGQVKARIRA